MQRAECRVEYFEQPNLYEDAQEPTCEKLKLADQRKKDIFDVTSILGAKPVHRVSQKSILIEQNQNQN